MLKSEAQSLQSLMRLNSKIGNLIQYIMRTILVIYSNVRVSETELKSIKKYAFNTESDVRVGDILDSNSYSTKMVVVRVLDEKFKYYDGKSGKMSNNFDSTNMADIKNLTIVEGYEDSITAMKVNED